LSPESEAIGEKPDPGPAAGAVAQNLALAYHAQGAASDYAATSPGFAPSTPPRRTRSRRGRIDGDGFLAAGQCGLVWVTLNQLPTPSCMIASVP